MLLWVLLLLSPGWLLAQESPAMKDAFSLLQFRTTIWNDTYNSLRNWYLSLSGDACSWKGIECSSSGRVTALQLSGLTLYGAISANLGELTQLTKLDLSNNAFMGGIPVQLVKCKELTEINFANNLLTADVPSELGLLPKLKVLVLNNNNLYGTLPSTLSNLTLLTRLSVAANVLSGYPFETLSYLKNLEFLDLSNNRFQGSILNQSAVNWPGLKVLRARDNRFDNRIPPTLGSLNLLQELDASRNSIEGSIPVEVSRCQYLTSMNLSFNALSGDIPAAVGQLPVLQTLDLRGNFFNSGIPTGTAGYVGLLRLHLSKNSFMSIPDGLATLPAVFYVDISENHLEGGIPVALGSMTRLVHLNFSYNNLSSNIPPQLSGCSSLAVLDLSRNLLTEIIPFTIIKMHSLRSLNLSDNQLSGRLPEEFGSLLELSELELSGNSIMGTIPTALGTLPKLRFLDLASNKLSGVIPSNLPFPASSFAGNADLCGPILNKSCTEYVGRTVAPGGMMASAAGLVITMIFIMLGTWWFCCRDDAEEIMSGSVPAAGVLRRFTAEAIFRATDQFSSLKFLGSASLCSVYRGEISDGMKVAVKVVCPEYYGGDRRSFAIEAKMFVKVIHPNVVKVIGCCNSGSLVALVLELMSNGSLESFLYGGEVCALSWIQRLDIILGIAEALAYMHHEWESLLFCDVRASSILLDDHFKAHISNYRLAAASPIHELSSSGQMPPEYMFSMKRTPQGDVYSYGILILEVLTRISPQGDVAWQGGLAKWVQQFYPQALSDIIDPQIMELEQQQRSIALCTEVALLCTQETPEQRPPMSDVVHMLQKIRRSKELTDIGTAKRRKSFRKRSSKRTSQHSAVIKGTSEQAAEIAGTSEQAPEIVIIDAPTIAEGYDYSQPEATGWLQQASPHEDYATTKYDDQTTALNPGTSEAAQHAGFPEVATGVNFRNGAPSS